LLPLPLPLPLPFFAFDPVTTKEYVPALMPTGSSATRTLSLFESTGSGVDTPLR
jgi:hypothetical protein